VAFVGCEQAACSGVATVALRASSPQSTISPLATRSVIWKVDWLEKSDRRGCGESPTRIDQRVLRPLDAASTDLT
jgi:hypothetical protein